MRGCRPRIHGSVVRAAMEGLSAIGLGGRQAGISLAEGLLANKQV